MIGLLKNLAGLNFAYGSLFSKFCRQMIFPICYGAARAMVGKAGKLVGIRLRPHDLRRHAATFASRSNVPLEIISKVILRHSSLQTTEIYLGKVSDTEAIRWIENLYA